MQFVAATHRQYIYTYTHFPRPALSLSRRLLFSTFFLGVAAHVTLAPAASERALLYLLLFTPTLLFGVCDARLQRWVSLLCYADENNNAGLQLLRSRGVFTHLEEPRAFFFFATRPLQDARTSQRRLHSLFCRLFVFAFSRFFWRKAFFHYIGGMFSRKLVFQRLQCVFAPHSELSRLCNLCSNLIWMRCAGDIQLLCKASLSRFCCFCVRQKGF